MAVDAPKGLVPIRKADGSPFTGPLKKVVISSSDSVAVYVGDIVYHTGSSPTTGSRILGEDVSGIPLVAKLSTTYASNAVPAVAGVVVGVKPNPDNLARKYRAASTDAILFICNDPNVVYEMQEDADTTPIVAASIGLNFDIAYGAGTAATGISGLEIDSTATGTATSLPLRVIGLSKKVDNDFYAGNGNINGKFEVMINIPMTDAPNGGIAA